MDTKTQTPALLENQTYFAPAPRDSQTEIASVHRLVDANFHLTALWNTIPLMVLILNSKRQIVAANQRVFEALEATVEQILGKRPGELVGCVHAKEGPNGCGTSMACRVCGAVNAILQTQADGCYRSEECRIPLEGGQALDWKVTTSPIILAGYSLQCLVIEDICDRKRRQVLERVFFHDMVNTIGAIVGFSRMLAEEQDQSEELQEVIRLADELLEEVQNQRELMLAESGDLVPRCETIELKIFLNRLAELYRSHPVAEGRTIVVQSPEGTVTTDGRLLKRILGNMIKNALEASDEGDTVSVFVQFWNGQVAINVHNPAAMSEEVKLQVFNRSFSTKGGVGRGIGTYSMKLLGEHYLGGRVSFVSEDTEGTTFSITLPQG